MTHPLAALLAGVQRRAFLFNDDDQQYYMAADPHGSYVLLEDVLAALSAAPVGVCTWPSCGHTAKGQCLPATRMAALTPAPADEVRRAALLEAADSLLDASVWCDSQDRASPDWDNGVADARKHHIARIRALIEKEQPK